MALQKSRKDASRYGEKLKSLIKTVYQATLEEKIAIKDPKNEKLRCLRLVKIAESFSKKNY